MALRDVVRRKAWFLETLIHDVDFPDALACLREQKERIDAMPTRGSRQRDRQRQAHAELDANYERLARRVGTRVLESYRFVQSNHKHVTKKTRKRLGLED